MESTKQQRATTPNKGLEEVNEQNITDEDKENDQSEE